MYDADKISGWSCRFKFRTASKIEKPKHNRRKIQMATKTEVKIRPLGERVIVTALPQEEKTKGGIILPDTAKEKPQQGEVVAVGTGKITDDGKTIPMNVKVGDKVLYGKYSGTEVKIDGEDYLIIKESEILGILA
jgi:chaperonin GroES